MEGSKFMVGVKLIGIAWTANCKMESCHKGGPW
jgi:hypothetical protein